jgi:4'-phosphopantetheinyl transferase EntD
MAVSRRRDGSPGWPKPVLGSISHWGEWCAVAVVRAEEGRSIGIDGERRCPLPRGVERLVLTPTERLWIDGIDQPWEFETALFAIKEATYKAWFPVAGAWLDFQEVEVALDARRESFRARIVVDGWHGGATCVAGAYAFEGDSVLAAASLPVGALDAGGSPDAVSLYRSGELGDAMTGRSQR